MIEKVKKIKPRKKKQSKKTSKTNNQPESIIPAVKNDHERLYSLFHLEKSSDFLEDVKVVYMLVAYSLNFEYWLKEKPEKLKEFYQLMLEHKLQPEAIFGTIREGFPGCKVNKYNADQALMTNYQKSFQHVSRAKGLNLEDKSSIEKIIEETGFSEHKFYVFSGLFRELSLLELYSLARKEAILPERFEDPQVFWDVENEIINRLYENKVFSQKARVDLRNILIELVSPELLTTEEEEYLAQKISDVEIKEIKKRKDYLHTRLLKNRKQVGGGESISFGGVLNTCGQFQCKKEKRDKIGDFRDLKSAIFRKWDSYLVHENRLASIGFSEWSFFLAQFIENFKPLYERFDRTFKLVVDNDEELNIIYKQLYSLWMTTCHRKESFERPSHYQKLKSEIMYPERRFDEEELIPRLRELIIRYFP